MEKFKIRIVIHNHKRIEHNNEIRQKTKDNGRIKLKIKLNETRITEIT